MVNPDGNVDHQINMVLYNGRLKSVHSQSPLRLISDIDLDTENTENTEKLLEEVTVFEWSPTDTKQYLECLAILKEVIMISVERSYAWVIDDAGNCFTDEWKCGHCEFTQKIKPLLLDVSSLRSISSIEVRKFYLNLFSVQGRIHDPAKKASKRDDESKF